MAQDTRKMPVIPTSPKRPQLPQKAPRPPVPPVPPKSPPFPKTSLSQPGLLTSESPVVLSRYAPPERLGALELMTSAEFGEFELEPTAYDTPWDDIGEAPKIPPPTPAPTLRNEPQGRKLLGQILLEQGLLTAAQHDQIRRVMAQPDNTLRFGEIAVRLGFLSREALDRALGQQKSYAEQVREEQSRMIPLPAELVEEVEQPSGEEAEKLFGWLASALRLGASDLHLMVGRPIVVRRVGELVESKSGALDADALHRILTSVLKESEKQQLKEQQSVIKCFDLPGGGRARGIIYQHMRGTNGVFRLVPSRVPTLVELNLPSSLGRLTTYAQGLVLITGPMSSGKTTTLTALVNIINEERYEHIIFIDRPLEHIIANRCSIVTQREVGTHTLAYLNALRASLREDPDIIVIGQMQDTETARLALTAAETGHLVFATLHTADAVRSISRILDMFPPDERNQIVVQFSESLRGVVSQRLLPRADGAGRVPLTEVLFATPAIRRMIRDQSLHQIKNAMKLSRELGNVMFDENAGLMLEKGLITRETYERAMAE